MLCIMARTGPRRNQYSLATPKKRPRTLDISEGSTVPPFKKQKHTDTPQKAALIGAIIEQEELPPIDRAPKRRLYRKLVAVFKGICKFCIYAIGKL